MFSPLSQMLLDTHRYELVDESNVDAFLSRNAFSVLFFAGDAERLAESDDVAVILPELIKVFGDRLTPALVKRDETEKALQRRYRFNAFPALVFLKGEGYLGAISRVQDWQDYVKDIAEILSREPSAPPSFKFPEGCYTAGMQAAGAASAQANADRGEMQ